MKKQELKPKLLTYAFCVVAIALGATVLTLVFHCPLGWKAVLWVGLAALGLALLLPVKRYIRTVPTLTALFLAVSLLCCTYVEPYFIKEALASEGSPFAKGNVWMAAWVVFAVGLFYLMIHLLTKMMDRLSPNEELFDENTLTDKAASQKSRAVLACVLSVVVVAVGIFSAVCYNQNVAIIPEIADHSEADYTVVLPNIKAELADEAANTVGYGAYYKARYYGLTSVPTNQCVWVEQSVDGAALGSGMILRHKDHSFNPAKDAEILKIAMYGFGVYGKYDKSLSDQSQALITDILRGKTDAPAVEVTDPKTVYRVEVTFKDIGHLWWEADVVSKDGAFYLRVATNTDFSHKDTRFDPGYVFYLLDDIY